MVGVRRAIALLLLGFYVTQFSMTAWLGPSEIFACYLALALCYALAFVALAAEWFWARWFAIGIGNFGSLLLIVLFKVGLEPIIAFFGFTHLAIAVLLYGEGMAARYEHSEATAERWNFQEESLILMRRAVKSAGSTIPFLILYALAPRPEWHHFLALALGIGGFAALVRGKTAGVLLLGSAGAIALADALGAFGGPTIGYLFFTPQGFPVGWGSIVSLLAGMLILIPLMWTRPILRFMRAA